MKAILLFGVICIIGFLFNPGEPVPGAEVYIEEATATPPVAFQQTGDNGKVTFSHLPKGTYRIKIALPQQSGKYMRGSDRINCELQVGYHNNKKEYFLRETEGFFTIQYSKIKRFTNKNITPVYHSENGGRGKRLEIGKFEVSGNNGSFTMEVRAQKPKKFKQLVEKVRGDVDMITIRKYR